MADTLQILFTPLLLFLAFMLIQIPTAVAIVWFFLRREQTHANLIVALETRHEAERATLNRRAENVEERLFTVINAAAQSMMGLTTTVEYIVNLTELKKDIQAIRQNPSVAISGGEVNIQKDLIGGSQDVGRDQTTTKDKP